VKWKGSLIIVVWKAGAKVGATLGCAYVNIFVNRLNVDKLCEHLGYIFMNTFNV
jgi:hypothetical protein